MIKIKDLPAPAELTTELVAQLTEEFKQTGKPVWKKDYIGKQILAMSENKCCFSECKLLEEGKYLEVEHFHPKSIYPDEVLDWQNLLPISSAVNKAKLDHDTKVESIINPRFEDPKEHLAFKSFRYKGKTSIGEQTWKTLGLNDWILWWEKRTKIACKAIELLEEISSDLQEFDNLTVKTTQKRNKIVSRLRNLFTEGTPKAEYSAVVASYILHDNDYEIIKNLLIKNDLWDDEFKELEQQLKFCALDVIS